MKRFLDRVLRLHARTTASLFYSVNLNNYYVILGSTTLNLLFPKNIGYLYRIDFLNIESTFLFPRWLALYSRVACFQRLLTLLRGNRQNKRVNTYRRRLGVLIKVVGWVGLETVTFPHKLYSADPQFYRNF